ncbi:MAG: hypothetical protein ACTSW1_19535 [Candidatus Hodarchaeales archaeon]
MSNDKVTPGLGLFFGVLQFNKRPLILWSGSTWQSDYMAWDLLLKILDLKKNLENIGWNFLPIVWDEIEIFALTKLFQIKNVGSAYLVIFHESPEILTKFLLLYDEELTNVFEDIFASNYSTQNLSNEQLKQIRIKSQRFYEILSQLKI